MSIKTFRSMARELERAARKHILAPAGGGNGGHRDPDGEEVPDEPADDHQPRDPDPAGDERHDPQKKQAYAPIRLVIRDRRRAA